jgi:hypothetical protein
VQRKGHGGGGLFAVSRYDVRLSASWPFRHPAGDLPNGEQSQCHQLEPDTVCWIEVSGISMRLVYQTFRPRLRTWTIQFPARGPETSLQFRILVSPSQVIGQMIFWPGQWEGMIERRRPGETLVNSPGLAPVCTRLGLLRARRAGLRLLGPGSLVASPQSFFFLVLVLGYVGLAWPSTFMLRWRSWGPRWSGFQPWGRRC